MTMLQRRELLLKLIKEQSGVPFLDLFTNFVKAYIMLWIGEVEDKELTLYQSLRYVLEELDWSRKIVDDDMLEAMKASFKLLFDLEDKEEE